jgi:hypothetical protein
MADRTFASLVPRIQASVPGCPHATVVQYIRDAAIRTCERTLYWRYQQPRFNLTPGTFIYPFNKPADTQVQAIFGTLVNDVLLEPLILEQALSSYPMWADKYTTSGDIEKYGSQPRSITQISPHQFAVLPLPDANKPYNVRMFYALKPARSATGIDEIILDELEDAIVHGALQQLLVLPNVNWSDRELAAYHAKQFLSQVSERRIRANLGNARGTMRARMQPFGA